jgi:signal transduction histidine kinase
VRVVAKLAFAFFAISCLALFGYGFIAARRGVDDVEHSVHGDVVVLGNVLRDAVVSTWGPDGGADARRMLAATSASRGDFEVRFESGELAADLVEVDAIEDRQVVRASLPVVIQGRAVGVLVIERALPSRSAAFRAALGDELALALVLALGSVLLVGTLGGVLVGRPLGRIVERARRIGAGDLTTRLRSDRNDEIGDLKREINVMCERLADIQQRLDDEATARLATLEQLRHLDRLRTVGTLSSSIAHELGTPLNVLLLRGQSLVRGEADAPAVAAAGRTIVGQVEKMSAIVRQLLDFSRREPSQRQRVSLESVARRALDLLSSLARRSGVTASVDVTTPVDVEGDTGQLEQAITNLVMNAIHAMPRGGSLTLRISTCRADSPGGLQTLDAACLAVEDTGMGMDDETLRRVFEPFYTTKPAGQGTGLGLSVTCGIAEDHGGWVDATSTPGKGSTFTLTLPRAR